MIYFTIVTINIVKFDRFLVVIHGNFKFSNFALQLPCMYIVLVKNCSAKCKIFALSYVRNLVNFDIDFVAQKAKIGKIIQNSSAFSAAKASCFAKM